MYAGSTLTNLSGNILGVHQKVDRCSRKALNSLLIEENDFPSKKLLLHFEGKNGPDGLKTKSTGQNEPWYFYDPFDPDEGELLNLIEMHYKNLVCELKNNNKERAAFEAAWMAHAIMDGLTPAHQYPMEQELEKIRGENKDSRDSIYRKLIASGDTKTETIKKNWSIWGAKGLFTTHYLFEWGAATVMSTLPKRIAIPNRYELKTVEHLGIVEYYKRVAREVALLDIYDLFYKRGWTPKLAKITRRELAPRMAQTVTLAWYLAAKDAGIEFVKI